MKRRSAVVDRRPAWLEPLPVREWMRRPVLTVRSDALVGDVAKLMRTRQVRHVPVTDARERLVGIVTDRDLRQVIFDPAMQERLRGRATALERLAVGQVMTWGVLTVRPTTDLREAARLMKMGTAPERRRAAHQGSPDPRPRPAAGALASERPNRDRGVGSSRSTLGGVGFVFRVLANAAAIYVVAMLLPGIRVSSVWAALGAGLVLGLINAVVRPILLVLTLPVTLLTLGLFLFVLNGLCLWLTAAIVNGFEIAGFWWAVLGAVLVSLVSWVLTAFVSDAGRIVLLGSDGPPARGRRAGA